MENVVFWRIIFKYKDCTYFVQKVRQIKMVQHNVSQILSKLNKSIATLRLFFEFDNWKDFDQKVRQITMVQFFLKTVVIWRKIFKWDICSQFSFTVYMVQRGGNLQGPLFVTKKLCLIAKLFHESSVFLTIESFDKSTCSISLLKQRFQIVFLLLLRSCTHKKWKWKPFFSFRPKPAAAAGSSNLTYVAYDIITHHGW